MAAKIDRSVRIVRALADVAAQVGVEGWEHDHAMLAELAAAVEQARTAAHRWAAVKKLNPNGPRHPYESGVTDDRHMKGAF